MGIFPSEDYGDNREFGIDGSEDVTIHFNNEENKTSADDTATDKYMNNSGNARIFTIINDKTIQIISYDDGSPDGITLTDPDTINIGDGSLVPALGKRTENFITPIIAKMVIRTGEATGNLTNIHIRWRG